MDAQELQKVISTNIRDQRDISQEWMEVWGEIENWYGDIQRKETGQQLLERLQRQYLLKRNVPVAPIPSEVAESAFQHVPKKVAKKGDHIVIVKHDDKKLLGRVVKVTGVSSSMVKFNGGTVVHDWYYIADECDEWRPRGDA